MPQPGSNQIFEDLGFTGEETDADLFGSAAGTEDDTPDPAPPAPAPEPPAPEPAAPAAAPEASAAPTPQPAAPATPEPSQPSLADILARMEAQGQRQTQILERAIPQPAPAAPAPRPLPQIPEQYRGAIDEDTLRGAQVVMDLLGITPKLERLEQFEQAVQQREQGNTARDMILSQVPEMKDKAFQDEVGAEMTRTMDAMGVPNEMRGQFLNPIFVVQAGNAVKARRSQNAAVPAAPTPAATQAIASRAGGETQTEPVASSVSDTSQQPIDWLEMSEEDFAKRQAAILRKQNGSW